MLASHYQDAFKQMTISFDIAIYETIFLLTRLKRRSSPGSDKTNMDKYLQ
jgi:hypothetical protein